MSREPEPRANERVRHVELAACTLDEVAAAKHEQTVSVCIPCRDEAATIGQLCTTIRHELMERIPLVDELVVVDDRSTDDTAGVAAGAGATVVPIDKIHLEHGDGHGKGNVLWASLLASHGDIVVWIAREIRAAQTAVLRDGHDLIARQLAARRKSPCAIHEHAHAEPVRGEANPGFEQQSSGSPTRSRDPRLRCLDLPRSVRE